ncbi:MAG TPA: hypothetical protein VGL89_17935 [Candidatus Koribacter sp.]|jgi:tetratricopeptide (TPR) repeat protein
MESQSQPTLPQIAGIRLTPGLLLRFGLLLIFCLYLRDLRFEFVYDDLMIPISPYNQSWHSVLQTFTNDVFSAMGERTTYYRPIATALGASIALLTPGTSAWFHLAAILIHIALCVICFYFTRLLWNDDRFALLTTMLFALHPTKVECVAWVGSSLCDAQAAIYFFLVLTFYLHWFASRRAAWLCASCAIFLFAIFTKETMIVLPVLVAVHWVLNTAPGRRLGGMLALLSPYIAITGFYLFVRHLFVKPLPEASNAIHASFNLSNIYSAPSAFFWYVQRLFYPHDLAILYDWKAIERPDFFAFILPLIGGLAFIALIFLAWRQTCSWKLLFFAAWFILTLGPVIALAPSVTVHDRYLELASYPFCALIAAAILRFANSFRRGAIVFAFLLLAAYSVSTFHEASYWHDSFSLWGRAVQVAPRNVIARSELARLYAVSNPPNYAKSVAILDDGLRLLPDSPGLWRTRGLFLFNAGDYNGSSLSLHRSLVAADDYLHAHGSEPPDVHYGRATAEFFLGQIELVKGNAAAADTWLRKATRIEPDNVNFQQGMITALRKQGKTEEADQHEKIIRDLVERSTMKLPH